MADRSRGQLPPVVLTCGAAVIGIVFTGLVLAIHGLRFAYRSPDGHLAMENLDASIAALVAVLFYGRYRRSAAVRDLLVSVAFALSSACGFMLVIVPAVTTDRAIAWTSWIPLVVRLFAAGLIATAATRPADRVTTVDHIRALLVLAVCMAFGLVVLGVVFRGNLPQPLNPTLSPAASTHPVFVGSKAVLVAQALHVVLYGFASIAFTVHAQRTKDDLTRWLAAGCMLAAFARFNYLLFPSLYSQYLYVGDFLRTGFYIVLGVGAVRELFGFWTLQADAAVFAERRRIARDLHDGTVQELGYIRTLARQATTGNKQGRALEAIGAAAERALAEARQSIAALSMPLDESLVAVVRRVVGEIADRYDVDVRVAGSEGPHNLGSPTRDAIVRVVREAVSNAVRHSSPSLVQVRLSPGIVEVQDNGSGFDAAASSNGGFGLVSMRDRAEAIGASLQVDSSKGTGTTVRMIWGADRRG
jgi:signal transduction histidine kinase